MSSYHFVLLWSCYTSTCCSIKSLNVWCCIWNLRIQLQELYVCSSSFCSWDGETCLVGLYYNFSWQRQKKKHHVHAAAGWAMLILNGASAVSFTTQKCLENKYPDWDIWDILYYLGLGTKCPDEHPFSQYWTANAAPLHVGDEEIGWIQMMGVVFRVGWLAGCLAGELNAQELLLLLTAKILGNSGIFQFAFKVHSESHCKWWYLNKQ